MLNLQDMRRAYIRNALDEKSVASTPFFQFEKCFQEALDSQVMEPNSMILATSNVQNEPNIRAVLLKIFDERGFLFFTNYNSDKAKEIEENPNVALAFLWLDLERQVRIIGKCEKISHVGTWISHQSSVISSRNIISLTLDK